MISVNGFFMLHIHDPAYAAPLLDATRQGNSTLAGIGINPGFVFNVMGFGADPAKNDITRLDEYPDSAQSAVRPFTSLFTWLFALAANSPAIRFRSFH